MHRGTSAAVIGRRAKFVACLCGMIFLHPMVRAPRLNPATEASPRLDSVKMRLRQNDRARA
jgi:hypothetical protein